MLTPIPCASRPWRFFAVLLLLTSTFSPSGNAETGCFLCYNTLCPHDQWKEWETAIPVYINRGGVNERRVCHLNPAGLEDPCDISANEDNPGGMSNRDYNTTIVENAIRGAIAQFNQTATGTPKLYYAGPTNVFATWLVCELKPGITVQSKESINGRAQWQVCYQELGEEFRGTVEISWPPLNCGEWGTVPNAGCDLQTTLLHELAHAWGLHHPTSQDENSPCAETKGSIMNGTAANVQNDDYRRRLRRYDIENLRELYDPAPRPMVYYSQVVTHQCDGNGNCPPGQSEQLDPHGWFCGVICGGEPKTTTPPAVSAALRSNRDLQAIAYTDEEFRVKQIERWWEGENCDPIQVTVDAQGTPARSWSSPAVAVGDALYQDGAAGATRVMTVWYDNEPLDDMDVHLRWAIRTAGDPDHDAWGGIQTELRPKLGFGVAPMTDWNTEESSFYFMVTYVDNGYRPRYALVDAHDGSSQDSGFLDGTGELVVAELGSAAPHFSFHWLVGFGSFTVIPYTTTDYSAGWLTGMLTLHPQTLQPTWWAFGTEEGNCLEGWWCSFGGVSLAHDNRAPTSARMYLGTTTLYNEDEPEAYEWQGVYELDHDTGYSIDPVPTFHGKFYSDRWSLQVGTQTLYNQLNHENKIRYTLLTATSDGFCEVTGAQPWVPRFVLSFDWDDGRDIPGFAGEEFRETIDCTLTTQRVRGTEGAQGWSISLGAEGVTIVGITTDGTAAAEAIPGGPGLRLDGYAVSQVTRGEGNEGAISAVVLDYEQRATLPPEGTSVIAKIDIAGTLPVAGETEFARLFYEDGRQGPGLPVENVVTRDHQGHSPVKGDLVLTLRGRSESQWVSYDCNGDGVFDLSDSICHLNFQFTGGAEPGCAAAMDFNGDRLLNIADPIAALTRLFSGGFAHHRGAGCQSYPECDPGKACVGP